MLVDRLTYSFLVIVEDKVNDFTTPDEQLRAGTLKGKASRRRLNADC